VVSEGLTAECLSLLPSSCKDLQFAATIQVNHLANHRIIRVITTLLTMALLGLGLGSWVSSYAARARTCSSPPPSR
jgi:hypothetical protein